VVTIPIQKPDPDVMIIYDAKPNRQPSKVADFTVQPHDPDVVTIPIQKPDVGIIYNPGPNRQPSKVPDFTVQPHDPDVPKLDPDVVYIYDEETGGQPDKDRPTRRPATRPDRRPDFVITYGRQPSKEGSVGKPLEEPKPDPDIVTMPRPDVATIYGRQPSKELKSKPSASASREPYSRPNGVPSRLSGSGPSREIPKRQRTHATQDWAGR